MRNDMDKVLIERPRSRAWSGKQPKGTRRILNPYKFEDIEVKESMRRPWVLAWNTKEFSDLLGPLKKFLATRVGYKWDDVYSEIRTNISPNSKMQLHLLEHVYDFVERHVMIIDGEVIGESGYPVNNYYVHPETGILTAAPKKSKVKKKESTIRCINCKYYIEYKGVWYLIKLKKLPEINTGLLYDVLEKKRLKFYQFAPYNYLYGGFFYAVYKRQLNKKEIKSLNLRGCNV
jgi:hypothetical protein